LDQTLKKKKDFERVYSEGARFDCSFMVFFWVPNDTGYIRAGYSTSRKVGKACKRNLVRRWLKNAGHELWKQARLSRSPLCEIPGIDFVVKTRPNVLKQDYWKVYDRFSEFVNAVLVRQEKQIERNKI